MAAENQPYDPDERDDLAVLDFTHPADHEDDGLGVPMFIVANPPGTVTVTTFMDGRVKQIELSSRTTELTEPELADEIVVIAGLATREAKSAQYAFSTPRGPRAMLFRPPTTTRIATPSPQV